MKSLTNEKIGDVVARDYRAASVFTKFGIDYCCGGQRTIDQACKQRTVDPDSLVSALEQELKSPSNGGVDFNSWPLDLLVDYIEKTHHNYVRTKVEELPPLLHKLSKVHGSRFPFLHDIRTLFEEVRLELLSHMQDEEQLLFPLIRKKTEHSEFLIPDRVKSILENMEKEHDHAGNTFKKIAALTDQYMPPASACTTHKVTYAMLKDFEDNLHMHVHLENNILFPKFMAG